MSNTPYRQESQRESAPSIRRHEEWMGELASQITTLTAQVTRVSEQMGELVTAVKLMQQTMTDHTGRIKDLEDRERDRDKAGRANAFTLGNNAVTWLIMMLVGIIGAILTGHLH